MQRFLEWCLTVLKPAGRILITIFKNNSPITFMVKIEAREKEELRHISTSIAVRRIPKFYWLD
jgi:hypothetical protein